jgi:hypothetical protein
LRIVCSETSSSSSFFKSVCNSCRYMSGRCVSLASNQSAHARHRGVRSRVDLAASCLQDWGQCEHPCEGNHQKALVVGRIFPCEM